MFAMVGFLAVLPAYAQQKVFAYELKNEWPLALSKGSTVIVKIPTYFWQGEKDQRKDLKIWTPSRTKKAPPALGLPISSTSQTFLANRIVPQAAFLPVGNLR